MEMLLKTTQYALEVMVYLAQKQEEDGEFISVQQMNEELQIPSFYLAKVARQLTQRGFLESSRGLGGGFRLRSNPKQISLYDVIVAMEGRKRLEECVICLPECGQFKGCTFHRKYLALRAKVNELFKKTSIADIVRDIQRVQKRLHVSQDEGHNG